MSSCTRAKIHSYRDLPVRYAELGTVYRNERSGTLHGLLRVRGFTQDDAHIFCTPEQLDEEVDKCFDLAHEILTTFGFDDYKVELSAHDPENMEKYAGHRGEWQMAEAALLKAIEKRDIPFEKMPGEAVFYGPKIDLKLIDAIGQGLAGDHDPVRFQPSPQVRCPVRDQRREQGICLYDPQGSSRLDREVHRHPDRALRGAFPALARSCSGCRHTRLGRTSHDYASNAAEKMKAAGIRAECGSAGREARLSGSRDAEMKKIPYMAVCGEKGDG